MARPVILTKALTADSVNAVAHVQKPLAAGNLTLTASPVVLDTQRRVLFTFAADETGHTFSVYGKNQSGAAIREDIAGTTAGTVASDFDFLEIDRVAIDAAATGNITVGTNTVGSTPWALFDNHLTPPWLGLDLELQSGTGNVSVEYTLDNFLFPNVRATIYNLDAMTSPTAIALGSMASRTASTQGSIDTPIFGWRLTVNSGTGTWQLTGIQSGLSSP